MTITVDGLMVGGSRRESLSLMPRAAVIYLAPEYMVTEYDHLMLRFFDWVGFVKTRMTIAAVVTAVLVAVIVVLCILYWLAYANAD